MTQCPPAAIGQRDETSDGLDCKPQRRVLARGERTTGTHREVTSKGLRSGQVACRWAPDPRAVLRRRLGRGRFDPAGETLPAARSAASRTVRALSIVVALMSMGAFVQDAQAQVTVFPLPGARYAMPTTQITFRGVSPGEIGGVRVVGSKSGVHSGTLRAHSDGAGASFLAAEPFTPGETVTVTTAVSVLGGSNGSFSFGIATPASPIAPAPLPRAPAGSTGVQRFHSRPDLVPPSVTVTNNSAPPSAGDIFLAPQFGPVQDGPMIVDPSGQVVWFDPTTLSSKLLTTDFRVQNLYGQPVLTWWQGYTNSGSGRGEGVIFDRNYRLLKIVRAGNGLQMDLHEFLVTPQGQAYVIAAAPVRLAGWARPAMDSIVQEIDIRTGLVMFSWDALDHVSLSESYLFGSRQPGHILDPYHVNSIALDHDGNLIISARNTSTIYKVDHSTGNVIWRLGGKRSSFKMGPGTRTAFQHNATVQPDGTITIFDDGGGPPRVHTASRGIRIALDTATMTATLVGQYSHRPATAAAFEGGVQALGGGETFVGWGQQPYFSEYDASGRQDYDARFTAYTSSYRAYRFPWDGQPTTKPALAISTGTDGTITPYVSWNGATSVAGWRVLAGPGAASLAPVRQIPKRGFESAIPVHSGEPYFAVQALSSSGRVVSSSRTTAAPAHLAIYGRSAFIAPGGMGGLPVSCLAKRTCSASTSVWSGHRLLARSGRERLAAGSGGILYFRLSPVARKLLKHARGGRLPVQVTVRDRSGIKTTARLSLIAFHTSGGGPRRDLRSSRTLRITGATDFVSARGVGGVLTACLTTTTCDVRMTVSAGGNVIARTGRESIGADELGYVMFRLTPAGRSMLVQAAGGQLAAHVTIADNRTTTTGDIALVAFR